MDGLRSGIGRLRGSERPVRPSRYRAERGEFEVGSLRAWIVAARTAGLPQGRHGARADGSFVLRRAVCRGLRSGVVAAALFAAHAGGSGADQELWQQVERLLAAGIADASKGNFDGAWASFRDAFVRGGSRSWSVCAVRRIAGGRVARACPTLARLLGKPRAALDFLSSACPDMTDHRCRRWAASLREGGACLGDEAASPAAAQELELRLWFEENGDPRSPTSTSRSGTRRCGR